MTKGELVKALEPWPDSAEVQVSVRLGNLMDSEPEMVKASFARELEKLTSEVVDRPDLVSPDEKVWLDIGDVEEPTEDEQEHCLIYTGKVVMG